MASQLSPRQARGVSHQHRAPTLKPEACTCTQGGPSKCKPIFKLSVGGQDICSNVGQKSSKLGLLGTSLSQKGCHTGTRLYLHVTAVKTRARRMHALVLCFEPAKTDLGRSSNTCLSKWQLVAS